ncbi:MAG TPA: hypothetical protein VFE02_01290 [Candidatus Acidoferrales bacterium]|jgi:hypothetical protein|nr:hypothetical protein [Candidatus Acidoferrales bacterium]
MKKSSKHASRDFFPIPGSDGIITKKKKDVPHEFVLEAISSLSPWTRPMFGCLAVYVENKIVLILRDKPDNLPDNGIWLATTSEHHESLRRDFPSMRSIQVLGSGVTGWQVLPQENKNFEAEAQLACELVLARDPRIGKIPKSKRITKTKKHRKDKRFKRVTESKPAPKKTPRN